MKICVNLRFCEKNFITHLRLLTSPIVGDSGPESTEV